MGTRAIALVNMEVEELYNANPANDLRGGYLEEGFVSFHIIVRQPKPEVSSLEGSYSNILTQYQIHGYNVIINR